MPTFNRNWHSLVFPIIGKVESRFSSWQRWSVLLKNLAQKAEILLPIDILWGGDSELSLMLAFDNQQTTKERQSFCWAAVDGGSLLWSRKCLAFSCCLATNSSPLYHHSLTRTIYRSWNYRFRSSKSAVCASIHSRGALRPTRRVLSRLGVNQPHNPSFFPSIGNWRSPKLAIDLIPRTYSRIPDICRHSSQRFVVVAIHRAWIVCFLHLLPLI